MALLNSLIDFEPIVDMIWKKLEPHVTAQLDRLREQVVALLPVIGAAAAKAISEKFPDLVQAILKKDPDLPVVSDIFDLSELIRDGINGDARLPNIPGLNVLGELFMGIGGR